MLFSILCVNCCCLLLPLSRRSTFVWAILDAPPLPRRQVYCSTRTQKSEVKERIGLVVDDDREKKWQLVTFLEEGINAVSRFRTEKGFS